MDQIPRAQEDRGIPEGKKMRGKKMRSAERLGRKEFLVIRQEA